MARPAVPVFAGELDLAELMADHPLFNRRQRPLVSQNLDVVAIPGIRGDSTGRGVGMHEKTHGLEVRQDVPNGGAADAKGEVRDERTRADRRCRNHVFVDDGPQDCARSRIQ